MTSFAQKIKFSINDFLSVFSDWEQICSFLHVCSHLLKMSLMEKYNFLQWPMFLDFLNSQSKVCSKLKTIKASAHFMPLVPFYTPWNHQKTRGFLMFSEEGIERDQWHEMDFKKTRSLVWLRWVISLKLTIKISRATTSCWARHICEVLCYLIPFLQFKKREKHPQRSVTFSKVAG